MKYILFLGDGMADYPVPELDGKTPLQVANIPHVDFLAQHGEVGLVQSIPHGMPPGSDVANLGLMGYASDKYYSGRSPLEAISMGIDLKDDDVTYRCNLVCISDDEDLKNATMLDHSSGEITTEEARELVKALQEELDWDGAKLYPGVSYRHCLVVPEGQLHTDLTPPHDIVEKKVGDYLPKGPEGERLLAFMEASRDVLRNHPVNLKRIEEGKNPANICWFWGEGTRPKLDPFVELYGKTGGVVSAVDLLKGIGICAGLEAPDVEGATGTLDTNYAGKLDAAWDILERKDFVYIHFEGPDECGHQGNAKDKVTAIERLDELVMKPLLERLKASGEDYHILFMPDHATPIVERTHTSDPIPYVLYKSEKEMTPHAEHYDEVHAKNTGVLIATAPEMMQKLLD